MERDKHGNKFHFSGIWILIPAYNAEVTLEKVLNETLSYCNRIVVVNDGSEDHTREIAESFKCVVLSHDRNRGKGAALRTGFKWLLEQKSSAVITLDADGQHDPAEIPKFLELFRNMKSDVLIIGSRVIEKRNMPFYRNLPNRIGEFFISLAARKHIHDTQSGFRLYSKGVIDKIKCSSEGFDMEAEILIKASRNGISIYETPIRTIYPKNYTSHFKPVRDFYKISKVVLKNIL